MTVASQSHRCARDTPAALSVFLLSKVKQKIDKNILFGLRFSWPENEYIGNLEREGHQRSYWLKSISFLTPPYFQQQFLTNASLQIARILKLLPRNITLKTLSLDLAASENKTHSNT